MKSKEIAFAVLDIETTPFSEDFSDERIETIDFELACIVFFNFNKREIKEKRVHFYSVNELCDFLLSECSTFPIYCHNLGFDFKFIGKELLNRTSYFKLINTPSRTLSVKFYKQKSETNKRNILSLDLRCSLVILLSSVKSLGENINLPKLEIQNNNFKDLDYCYRDCEIVGYSLFDMIDFVKELFHIELKPNQLPLTIGSIAKKCFTSIYPNVFYKYDWHIHRNTRKYYFGGRTEVFDFNNVKEGVCMDVVSLYPWVASHYRLPNGYCYSSGIEGYSIESYCKFHIANRKEKKYHIFGFECEIIENQDVPLYFERLERVICVNGKKTVFMTLQEYRELKDMGIIGNEIKILKPLRVYGSKKLSTYRKFFKPLFRRKLNPRSKSERYFCKIFMNSLTGKLGQKPERKDTTYYNLERIDVSKDIAFDIDLDASYTEKEYIQNHQTANLLSVVGLLSLARFTLWKQIYKLKQNNERVYYCDTDSIFTDKKAIKFFNLGKDLGCWDIEHDNITFQAIDTKEYIYQENNKPFVKFKGLLTKHFTTSDFYIHYFDGSISRIIPKNRYCDIRKIPHESIIFMRKNKRHFYFKRLILKDLTTIPLNSKNLSIDSVKEHNKKLIFQKILKPNLCKI